MRVSLRSSFFAAFMGASVVLTLGLAGCNKNSTQDSGVQNPSAETQPDQSQDPAAAANLAPASAYQPTGYKNGQEQGYSQDKNYSQDQNFYPDDDADYDDSNYGQPEMDASEPPPPLPEYSQPECPGDGYLWTPGYWSYASAGYYWVPGAWARPPEVGLLWTPGYWGFVGGRYRFHYGFWGRHIGYYGGINYGFGYVGAGYQGGYWSGDRFEYNRAVNNITITNVRVYNRTVTNTVVINNTTINTATAGRASYNGPGGVSRRPLPAEIAATREQRVPPMTTQLEQQHAAAQNHEQFASVNHGRPAVVAAAKPVSEGKPIAPIVAARPAPPPRPAPTNPQPNRAEPNRAVP